MLEQSWRSSVQWLQNIWHKSTKKEIQECVQQTLHGLTLVAVFLFILKNYVYLIMCLVMMKSCFCIIIKKIAFFLSLQTDFLAFNLPKIKSSLLTKKKKNPSNHFNVFNYISYLLDTFHNWLLLFSGSRSIYSSAGVHQCISSQKCLLAVNFLYFTFYQDGMNPLLEHWQHHVDSNSILTN